MDKFLQAFEKLPIHEKFSLFDRLKASLPDWHLIGITFPGLPSTSRGKELDKIVARVLANWDFVNFRKYVISKIDISHYSTIRDVLKAVKYKRPDEVLKNVSNDELVELFQSWPVGAVVLPSDVHGPGPDVISFLSTSCLLVVAVKQSDVIVSSSDNCKNRQTTDPGYWWPDWRGKGAKNAKRPQTKQKKAWNRAVLQALAKHKIGLLIRVSFSSSLFYSSHHFAGAPLPSWREEPRERVRL
jgi:hypothetical protein